MSDYKAGSFKKISNQAKKTASQAKSIKLVKPHSQKTEKTGIHQDKNSVNSIDDVFSAINTAYLEEQYQHYLSDPDSVEPSFKSLFESAEFQLEKNPTRTQKPSWQRADWPMLQNGELVHAFDGNWSDRIKEKLDKPKSFSSKASSDIAHPSQSVTDSMRALMLIRAYRTRGHLAANLDPLKLSDFGNQPELDPANYGFGPKDMQRPIFTDGIFGVENASLKEIITLLRQTYCQNIGIQFMHISNPEEKSWIQNKIEGHDRKIAFSKEEKINILKTLLEAESFEKFLHKRFPGTKRFGLDGAEATIAALEKMIKLGSIQLGVDTIVLGMPHRGRLNILASVMEKPYRIIFAEFQGSIHLNANDYGSGDVKYHLGASSDRQFKDHHVHLSLTANPSHLEAVNPVVLGKSRAKQTHFQLKEPHLKKTRVLPLLLHGDAAFSGQGIVSECFGLSGLKGHRTHGTIHFIVNNQIGFTTSPKNSRSSPYPSDVALMVQAPILHVNGDDPEAVVYAANLAIQYRQKFAKDVVIDLFCYRRYGHNEGDDPTFTQPLMYEKIRNHASVCQQYAERLINENILTKEAFKELETRFEAFLDSEFEAAKTYQATESDWLDGEWSGLGLPNDDRRQGNTAVPSKTLHTLGLNLTKLPDTLNVHKTIHRIYDKRRKMIETGENIDWATAESLAFASLLAERFPVRLSGQDSSRGTFSQRHSQIIDQKTEQRYTPLNHVKSVQSEFEVIDSMLSEEAVLGFEYGYSLVLPNSLVLWEAQFGDFANGAQVIIDQFIASGERKWLRMSGIVLLLPHGYEGQGPEHSSARLERYLQLCAEDNMQVANCTTPANYFHILRRQVHRNFRKPLILMTPKSLLRHKLCVSSLKDMSEDTCFHRILIDDAEKTAYRGKIVLKKDTEIKRVVLCSGKVYYDLFNAREQENKNDIYLLRIEQFYPYPERSLNKELKRFPNADFVWCQEEPKNMGAWQFIEPRLEQTLKTAKLNHIRPIYIGRSATASTAAGTLNKHIEEVEHITNQVMNYHQKTNMGK